MEWCETTKYLVAYFQGGSSVIGLMLCPAKREFFAACNAVFLHSSGVNELALLRLQELTYSLSVRMYAIPASNLPTMPVGTALYV